MGGGSSQQLTLPAAPVAPTIDNSQVALEAARKQQKEAKGAAATLISTQTVGSSGSSILAPGSSQTKKLTLGQ